MSDLEGMRISPDKAREMAELSGFKLDGDRAVDLAPQIQSLRESINAMGEVDLTDIQPAATFRLGKE